MGLEAVVEDAVTTFLLRPSDVRADAVARLLANFEPRVGQCLLKRLDATLEHPTSVVIPLVVTFLREEAIQKLLVVPAIERGNRRVLQPVDSVCSYTHVVNLRRRQSAAGSHDVTGKGVMSPMGSTARGATEGDTMGRTGDIISDQEMFYKGVMAISPCVFNVFHASSPRRM